MPDPESAPRRRRAGIRKSLPAEGKRDALSNASDVEGVTAGPSADLSVDYPSLKIIAEEVRLAMAAQDKQNDALDTKSGIVLGFSGVLVGVNVSNTSDVYLIGHGIAAVAGLLAVVAYLPRALPVIKPGPLRQNHLGRPDGETLLTLTDTRIDIYNATESRLERKARFVRAAVVVLAFAVATLVVGGTVKAATGGSGDRTRPRAPGPAHDWREHSRDGRRPAIPARRSLAHGQP